MFNVLFFRLSAFYDESISVLTEKVARGYYTFLSPWWDDISHSAKDLITHLLCVDPRQRYDIDEFLAHPWCQEMTNKPQQQAAPPPRMAMPTDNIPIDSPLLASVRAANREGRSPGVGVLKEAFDVSTAVHRMREEGAGRYGATGAGQRGFLGGLNEEDEEADEEYQLEDARRKHGEVVARRDNNLYQPASTTKDGVEQIVDRRRRHCTKAVPVREIEERAATAVRSNSTSTPQVFLVEGRSPSVKARYPSRPTRLPPAQCITRHRPPCLREYTPRNPRCMKSRETKSRIPR
jgi:hypothetical protein